MKRLPFLCLCFYLVMSGPLAAQPIEYFIEGNPMPSPYISDWEFQQQFQLFADNFSSQPQEVILTVELYDAAGELIGTKHPNATIAATIQPGFNNVELPNIFTPDNFLFFDPYDRSVRTTGRLPGGEYELCFQLRDAATQNPIGQPACFLFSIETLDPPVLIYPPPNATLSIDELPLTTFQWSLELTQSPSTAEIAYRFVMVRVFEGQSLGEAIRTNPPEVEELIFFEPVFQWPENLMSLPDDAIYAWSVHLVNPSTGETLTEMPVPRMISVTYAETSPPDTAVFPPAEEDDPIDSIPPPTFPPEYPRPDACNEPTFQVLPENPISVGMHIENSNVFKYPRAVPIRGEAIDWDLVEFVCTGCDGPPSKVYKAFRDNPDKFEWELVTEKGSLNKAFEAKEIDSLQQRNEAIDERLDEIEDSLQYIEEAVDSIIPGQIDQVEGSLETIEDNIASVDSAIDAKDNKKDSLEQIVSHKVDTMETFSDKMDSCAEQITKWQGKIDSFNTLLENNPSEKERQQQRKLRETQEEIDQKQQALEDAVALRDTTASQLQQQVEDARAVKENAAQTYHQLQQHADSMRHAISQIERQLYQNPQIRPILVNRRNWNAKAVAFNAGYYLGEISLVQSIYKSGFRIFYTSDSTERQVRLNDFQSELNQWHNALNGVCSEYSGEVFIDCHNQRSEVISSGNSYLQSVQSAVQQDVQIDPELLATWDTLRLQIVDMESTLENAKSQTEQAAQAYQNAVESYNTTIAQLEEQVTDLRNDLDTTNARFGKEQVKFNQMVQARNDSFEVMRPRYLEKISQHENTISALQDRSQRLSNSIIDLSRDTTRLSEGILEVKLEIEDLEEEKARLEELRENTEEEIDRLEQKMDELRARKDALEQEREDLQDERAENEEELEELSAPQKEADGPMVYYIPPPLEEVMQEEERFEELKEKVAKAEQKVQEALANKEAVQGKITGLIDNTAKNLMKYKALKNQIEAWEEEKQQLNSDLQKEKTEKAQEYQEDQEEIQDEYDDLSDSVALIEQKIANLKDDSTNLREELDQMQELLAAQDSLVKQLRQEVRDATAQLNYEQDQLRRATNTLNDKRDQLSEKMKELEEKKRSESKLKNTVARAEAAENDQAAQSARSDLDNLQQELNTLEQTAIPNLEGEVQGAASSVSSARQRVNSAEALVDTLVKRHRKAQQELNHELRDSLIAKSDRYRKVVNELTHWRKQLLRANQHLDNTDEKRQEYKDTVATKLDQDASIQAKEEEIAALEGKIDSAKKEREGLQRDIEDASGKGEEWIQEANDSIQASRDRLEDAREELREFLLEEFNNVEFEARIKLTVKNPNPIDQYRTQDDQEEYIGTLQYKSSRTPEMEGQDASDNIPSRAAQSGACVFSHKFEVDPAPAEATITQKDPGTDEPRTIALIYKEGKPLWPEWPVIGADVPLISKDVVRIIANYGLDTDPLTKKCEAEEACPPVVVETLAKEIGTMTWQPVDGVILNEYQWYQEAMWEPPKIDTPKPDKQMEIKSEYLPAELAADKPIKGKGEIRVEPGTMLETTEDFKGIPDTAYEVQTRVVTGDHQGLPGERVEFEATLIAGEAEDYQFEESGDTLAKAFTDGDGYAKVKFNMGEGYARFRITATWYRGSTEMDSEEFEAESPFSIQVTRFSTSAPDAAWEKALSIVQGEGGDPEEMADELPEEDKEQIHAVAGLYNHEREFVQGETVFFELSDDQIGIDPEETETKAFGLARTVLQDTIAENSEVAITASIEEKYQPVGDPAEDEDNYSTEKVKRFKIGSNESMFVVELEEPISPEEKLGGKGTLTLDLGTPTGILEELIGQEIDIHEVVVVKEGEEFVAQEGKISYTPSTPLSATMRGFTVELDSFVVPAKTGAGIGGNLQHASLETSVRYYAQLDHNGNFYGEVRDLPEFTISQFKLRQGGHVIIDMHNTENPGEMGSTDWHGVLIRTADLEMPNVFARGQGDPAVLSLRNSYIGSSGFGGSVTFEGPMFRLGYGGFELEASSFGFTFRDNELQEGNITANILLPQPMEGQVKTTVSYTGTEWSATAETENPVSIPRLGATVSLLEGSGITYDTEEEIATLTISGHLRAERFDSTFTITDFKLSSNGEVSAESIEIHQHYAFSGGFNVHVESISFAFTSEEYSMGVTGAFGFPSIGIDQLGGSVTIASGPEVSVELTDAEITFEHGPVDMSGTFSYTGREFKGEFNVAIKPVLKNGAKALIIVGNTEDQDEVTYVYWYLEVEVSGKIPLGQSGFRVANFGGGLGYNYDPPVGDEDGAPKNNDNFSVKAILGIEDQTGKLFNSRMELVLTESRLTLHAKAWLLEKEESLFGEGQLNCYWESDTVMDGYIAMLIGIPDAEGDIFKFEGRINFFLTNQKTFRVWSQTIDGSVLNRVNANARFDISLDSTVLEGNISMYESGRVGLLFFDLVYMYDLGAHGHFGYYNQTKTLTTTLELHGAFSLDAENSTFGTANIASGQGDLKVEFYANTSIARISADGSVEYDVWLWSGQEDFEIEHTYQL